MLTVGEQFYNCYLQRVRTFCPLRMNLSTPLLCKGEIEADCQIGEEILLPEGELFFFLNSSIVDVWHYRSDSQFLKVVLHL